EKRMQGNLNSWPEPGNHAIAVERNDLYARVSKVIGKEAGSKAKPVVGIRNGKIDFQNADLKRVAQFGILDKHRAIQDVSAGAFVGDLFIDIAQVLLHLVGRNAGFLEAC